MIKIDHLFILLMGVVSGFVLTTGLVAYLISNTILIIIFGIVGSFIVSYPIYRKEKRNVDTI